MAKGGGSAPSAPAAPAPTTTIGGAAAKNIQSIADIRDVDVVSWGNGEPVESAPAMSREVDPAFRAPAKVEPQRGEPDHPDEQVVGKRDQELSDEVEAKPDDKAKPDEPAKETPAEKRQRALDNLAAEKRARGLETQLKEAQGKLTASEKATLGDILKARGMSKDELLEKLLLGTDGIDLPPKLEGAAAESAELKAKVKLLEDKLTARENAESERQAADAVAAVASDLKDVGVPLIESLDAYGSVVNEAYELWQADGGKGGSSRSYVPQAAENVEKRLRAKHPRLAALADAAEKGRGATAAAAAIVKRPGITRRTTARPTGEPPALPADSVDRDAAIKKEMGWA